MIPYVSLCEILQLRNQGIVPELTERCYSLYFLCGLGVSEIVLYPNSVRICIATDRRLCLFCRIREGLLHITSCTHDLLASGGGGGVAAMARRGEVIEARQRLARGRLHEGGRKCRDKHGGQGQRRKTGL